jgi:hypothetical protein
VICFRSPSSAELSERIFCASGSGDATPEPIGARVVPHSVQKLVPFALRCPQDGHVAASAVPQLPQHFAPSGFVAPQLLQVIVATLRPGV